MNTPSKTLGLSLLCLAMKAYAQQPAPATAPASDPPAPAPAAAPAAPAPVAAPAKPPKATAQSEAGEPRANTSRPAPAQSEAGEPRAGTPKAPPAAARPPGVAGQKGPGASDRLQLGTATVTGDREQPKVMYVVPWKRSDIGDLAGKPMNSLVDEILAPVDRDVFKREVGYYKAVQADGSQNGAPGRPSQQGEK
ncbi:MAG TPA: hypothetical protein VE058_11430 [Steroidobacteraceae bacterium]|nr:hypothetical protein [Steroidobacteraceae bacterium]